MVNQLKWTGFWQVRKTQKPSGNSLNKFNQMTKVIMYISIYYICVCAKKIYKYMCIYKRLYTIYCHWLIASPILPRAAFQLIKHTFQTTLCGSSQFMFPTSKWKGLVDRLDILHIICLHRIDGQNSAKQAGIIQSLRKLRIFTFTVGRKHSY